MPCTMPYSKAVGVAWDQLFNAHISGWPDETLSSRAYRWRKNGIRAWPERWINRMFFWDRDKKTGKRHCELSFETERERRQLPPELRFLTSVQKRAKQRHAAARPRHRYRKSLPWALARSRLRSRKIRP